VTGLVNQELLLQNEYLAAENRILKGRLQPGWRLSDGERATLAEIGKRLGRKGFRDCSFVASPCAGISVLRIVIGKPSAHLITKASLHQSRCVDDGDMI